MYIRFLLNVGEGIYWGVLLGVQEKQTLLHMGPSIRSLSTVWALGLYRV